MRETEERLRVAKESFDDALWRLVGDNVAENYGCGGCNTNRDEMRGHVAERSDMDSREFDAVRDATIVICAEIAEHYCDGKQYGVGPDSDPAEAYKAAREFVQQGIAREIRRLVAPPPLEGKGE